MASLTKPAASAPPCRSPQIIEDRYIDDDKLLEICKEKFGLGNYHLMVRSTLTLKFQATLLTRRSSSSIDGTFKHLSGSTR